MKILVTGGSGFIGSNLCRELLRQGNEVVCMDNFMTSHRDNISDLMLNRNFEFVYHDVCDPFHVECDQIFHLACPASPLQYTKNPVRTIKTSILGTLNSLECARNVNATLLIASTSEIYGDPQVHPQVESYFGNVNTVGDRSCYDESKRASESLAYSWNIQYNTKVCISRIFNTYGPGMAHNDGRFIPNLIMQALNGKPFTIYGDGSQTRSWCYVSDTVNGLISLIDNTHHYYEDHKLKVFNIGNPEEKTISHTADIIADILNLEIEKIYLPLPNDDPKQRKPDITLAKNLLFWEPEVSFEDGMARTIAWFKSRMQEGLI